MALDTYLSIAGKVLLRCPLAGPLLARDWVSNSFRRLAERRAWSWLIKQSQFTTAALYNTGTVTVTQAPPPPQVETVVISPGPSYVWVGGEWVWYHGSWVWVSGRWIAPPRPGVVWVEARWVYGPGGYRHHPGYWR